MRKPRRRYQPSSGHKLVLLVSNPMGLRTQRHITRQVLESKRPVIANLAGYAGAEWAIDQLIELPATIKPGWPNPCKAARAKLRKAA